VNRLLSNRALLKSLFAFFIFGSLFPTLRVWLIGTESANGAFQLFVSVLPELFSILLLLLLAAHLIKQKKSEGIKISFSAFDWILVSFFILNILLGFIMGADLELGLYAFRLTYLPVAFYFIGRYFYPFNKNSVNEFLHWILYWIVALAVIGIVLYFGFPTKTAELIRWSGGRLMAYNIPRMTSIFWTPVLFASFVSLGTLFSYYNILLKNEIKYYIFFTIFCTCLFFCVSRGPLFTFLLGFLTLSIIFRHWKRFLICVLIATSLYLFYTFTIDSFDKILGWIFSSTIDTMMVKKGITRAELFTKTVHDLQTNPFGYGFGKAGVLATRFFTEDTPGISFYSTDCWYLKIACETGILGFISYMILIIAHGWNVAKYLRKNKKESLLIFIFILFILFNIENIVHNLPDYPLLANFYWLLMGVGQNYIRSNRD